MNTPTRKRAPVKKRKAAVRKAPAKPQVDESAVSLIPPQVRGFIGGAIVGVFLGAGGMAYLSKEVVQTEQPSTGKASTASVQVKPKITFPQVLPKQTYNLTEGVKPPDLDAQRANQDLYVLQTGSFRRSEDAEQLRVQLAFLGYEATVDQTSSDNGIWFRVYVGPFETRSEMERARSLISQESIDILVLRRPR